MASHGRTTQSALAQMRPMLEASELVAQSTLSHVNAVKAGLQTNEAQMTGHAEAQQALVARINGALGEADAALAKPRAGAEEFADPGGAKMAAQMGGVRGLGTGGAREKVGY